MSKADLETVLDDPLPYLGDEDAAVRRLALACCSGRLAEPAIREEVEARITTDDDGSVRAAAVELIVEAGPSVIELLFDARLDEDSRVVEAAATGMGRLGAPEAVAWLCDAAERHDDRLVREAAVAALGEIGDARAVPTLLTALQQGPPQVRRRAVVALTVFDDPGVEAALGQATEDRNPMVREAAEMVVGRRPVDSRAAVELRTPPGAAKSGDHDR